MICTCLALNNLSMSISINPVDSSVAFTNPWVLKSICVTSPSKLIKLPCGGQYVFLSCFYYGTGGSANGQHKQWIWTALSGWVISMCQYKPSRVSLQSGGVSISYIAFTSWVAEIFLLECQ
jgi:hypothetical protein